MPEECIFCRIVAGKMPAEIVYRDEGFLAFRDIMPQAPVHLLVIPRAHIESSADLADEQLQLAGRLIMIARTLAEEEGIAESGYRLVINCRSDGGQQVPHLHLHLIGGRKLSGRIG